MAQKDFRSLTP